MAKTKPEKRSLHLESFQDLMNEVHQLHSEGYIVRGNWTLGQICCHLADWMRFPMDGFPVPPWFLRPLFWLMKYTVAPSMKRKILRDGFKPGTPTAPDTVYPADEISDGEGVERLRAVIERIGKYEGDLHESPLFGPMDRDIWYRVNLRHAEHHLGFLEPK